MFVTQNVRLTEDLLVLGGLFGNYTIPAGSYGVVTGRESTDDLVSIRFSSVEVYVEKKNLVVLDSLRGGVAGHTPRGRATRQRTPQPIQITK